MKYDITNDNILNIVKTASMPELNELSSDIRSFLVDKVSRTGGHLASNLGIVELTIALHRVYDSPKDKIIFDVGHQSYVHKIITGRAADFDSLRKYKGMSGFPKARESEHDAYDTGHSSTSISAAYGMATARDLKGDDYDVVAVIGDGSMTGGIVYEALNNIGASKTNIKIILNDNGMSISRNVGSMSKHLTELRTSFKYQNAKTSIKSALDSVPVVGSKLRTGISEAKDIIKRGVISQNGVLFEDLGIKYIGPVDGHNIEDIIAALNAANNIEGPTLVHVITTKGKGYEIAEKNPSKFHGIGAFNPADGKVIASSNGPSYSEVFGKTVADLAVSNKSIVAITAAMGPATGLGPFENIFPDRFFDVGIAEQHAVVFATGLAKAGMTPVVAIYSSFMQRAFDFLIEDSSMQNQHVVFAIDRAGLVGADGETHHGMYDLSYMGLIPGMKIYAPAGGNQLAGAITEAIAGDGPYAVRYPRGTSVLKHQDAVPSWNGGNHVISEGKDIQILAVGSMIDNAIDAKEALEEAGYDVGVTNVCVIKPFDESLGKIDAKLVVTIEDNVAIGGFGEMFASCFRDKSYDVINYAIPDEFIEHGSVSELQKECEIDAESIVKGVLEHFEGKA